MIRPSKIHSDILASQSLGVADLTRDLMNYTRPTQPVPSLVETRSEAGPHNRSLSHNTLLTLSGDTSSTMTKPHILNQHERAALLALSQDEQVSARSDANRGFSRIHLETLLKLGLATRRTNSTDQKPKDFQISSEGWRCMYGLTKAQIDSQTDRKPVPFRVWQWPLPAGLKEAA